uniref:Uncharacterized protein n=1 Tax=Kalanchoe fedtschenkoi TaxID=63787 RepID=A0A7N0V3Z6_KALFE
MQASCPFLLQGLNLAHVDPIAALALNDKADLLNASYYHTVSPLSNTAVGAEVTHYFSTNENTPTIGTKHDLDPLTTLKARVDNYGKASALFQHEWRPKSFFTVPEEVDTKAIEKSAKVGQDTTSQGEEVLKIAARKQKSRSRVSSLARRLTVRGRRVFRMERVKVPEASISVPGRRIRGFRWGERVVNPETLRNGG